MSSNKSGNTCSYYKSGTCRFGSRCRYSHDLQVNSQGTESVTRPKIPRNRAKAKRQGKSRPADYMDAFFAQHEDFDYNPLAPVWAEFSRMCDEFGWDAEDFEMREARRNFKSAMVQQFNDLYGTDVNDLDSWHKLCRILNIEPVPEGLKECREASAYQILRLMVSLTNSNQRVRQTHVNLVDLVDMPRTGVAVRDFPNLKELQNYTIENEKYFPKENAYAGGLLRFLLREILNSRRSD